MKIGFASPILVAELLASRDVEPATTLTGGTRGTNTTTSLRGGF
jgi:hypothetical protein